MYRTETSSPGDIPLNIGSSIRLKAYGNALYQITGRLRGYLLFESVELPRDISADKLSMKLTRPTRIRLNEKWFREDMHAKALREVEIKILLEEIERGA